MSEPLNTPAPFPQTTMAMTSVSDGMGGSRLEMRPVDHTKKGKKNAQKKPDPLKISPGTAAQNLAQFIERIERLEAEKSEISKDISDVYSEAKANGYDAKAMRAIIKIRKLQPHDRQESEAILETYKAALGLD